MRIVYTSVLNPWDPRQGGGQRAVHDLACAMADRGHEVHVVYSGIGPIVVDDLPYRAHVVPHHERLYLNPLEFARLIGRRELAGAIVHVNGYEGALLRYVPRERVALVATSHHPDPPTLLDKPPSLKVVERARWFRRRIIPLLEGRALRSADLVTSPSRYGAACLRERGYVGMTARVEVVPYGVPPLPDVRARGVDVELACVARLDYHKGIDVLLRALSVLSGRKPRLDIVGRGLEEGALRRLASELNLGDRVRFLGLLDRPGVAAILAGASAFVLPSRSDNLPLAILEAMQAGLPIVATRVGGIPEEIRDGEEGLLVPPEDPEALAAALKEVLGDRELRLRLGMAAQQRAAGFTWKRAAGRHEELYALL